MKTNARALENGPLRKQGGREIEGRSAHKSVAVSASDKPVCPSFLHLSKTVPCERDNVAGKTSKLVVFHVSGPEVSAP